MLHTLYSQVSVGVTLSVAAFALVRGGSRERIAAVAVVVAQGASLAAQPLAHRFDPVGAFAVIDGTLFLLFVGLSWRAPSLWPLLAAAMQGVALAAHGLKLLAPRVDTWVYLTVLAATSYLVLALLAYGTWRSRRTPSVG